VPDSGYYASGTLLKVTLADGTVTTIDAPPSNLANVIIDYLAADATGVVYTYEDQIALASRLMLVSGGPPSPLVQGLRLTEVAETALDASSAYWVSDGGALMKVARTGGAPVTLATGLPLPTSLAVDGAFAYVTCQGTATAGATGSLVRVPLTGGAFETLLTGLVSPGSIALDATNVYWREIGRPNPDPSAAQGTISKLAK
jgi:hypothetical protein